MSFFSHIWQNINVYGWNLSQLNSFIDQSCPNMTLKGRIGKRHKHTGEARQNVCMGRWSIYVYRSMVKIEDWKSTEFKKTLYTAWKIILQSVFGSCNTQQPCPRRHTKSFVALPCTFQHFERKMSQLIWNWLVWGKKFMHIITPLHKFQLVYNGKKNKTFNL